MSDNNGKILVFLLQGSRYAADLAQIAEVCDPVPMSPIPLAPPVFIGAMNFHGDIVAAIDLALLLGLPGSTPHGKVIVLRREIASIAFHVDSVLRIISGAEVVSSRQDCSRLAKAVLDLPDGKAVLLDLALLSQEAENSLRKD